jgi:putative transposase
MNRRHLVAVLAEYVAHFNHHRPHRALHLHPPRPGHPVTNISTERIKRRSVPGGLINKYEPAA